MTFDATQWYSRFFELPPNSGASEAVVRAAEARLGVSLPPALRSLLRQTNWRDGFEVQLLGPPRLAMADDVLVFALGHQACSWWGIHRNELAHEDPPLLFGEHADRWVDANGNLSELLRFGTLVERLVTPPFLVEGDDVVPTGWEPIRASLVGLAGEAFVRDDAVVMKTDTGTTLSARTNDGIKRAMGDLGLSFETHVIEEAEETATPPDEQPVDDADATPWRMPKAPPVTPLRRLFRWLVS